MSVSRSRSSSPRWQESEPFIYHDTVPLKRPKTIWPRICVASMVIAAGLLLILGAATRSGTHVKEVYHVLSGTYNSSFSDASASHLKKPEGIKIVGVVFYGRRAYVDILDCYLRQNLVSNGGFLDSVMFMQNTENEDDVAYLDELLADEPLYTHVTSDADMDAWSHMWDYDFDDDTMYIKIDDDVLFVADNAIPEIVHTLIQHPEAHNVQTNVVNSPSTNWYHYHGGAVYPYLPELSPPPASNHTTWRPSELPRYPEESAAETYPWPEPFHDLYGHDKVGEEGGAPFANHRWLPLSESSTSLMKTPIEAAENDPWGRGWLRWQIGAQQHYSLFENIERNTMYKYHFGNGEGLYNPHYIRYKINLFAIWGRTIKLERPGEDDEEDFTIVIPKKLGMPVFVNTRAIVSHFSFGPQREIWDTDLLRRYRAYANDRVCSWQNQKLELTTKSPNPGEEENEEGEEAEEGEAAEAEEEVEEGEEE